MCIAIYKPEGIEIPYETLERCYNTNSDGAGYMFHKGGKLHVYKGFFSMADFWKQYKKDKKKECVIHFRIAAFSSIRPIDGDGFLKSCYSEVLQRVC